MKHKCDSKCIFFPIVDIDFYYYYDKNHVKRRKNSKNYICTYTDNIIDLKCTCDFYKDYNNVKGRTLFEK